MLALLIVSIFLTVALITGVILYPAISKRAAVAQRVAQLVQHEEQPSGLLPVRKNWQIFLSDLGGKLTLKAADFRTYRQLITSAGFRRETVYIFLGAKVLLAALLPTAVLLLYAIPQGKASGASLLLLGFIFATSGYLMPTMWLSRRAEARKRDIFHSLPDVLDLLTVCVEAGLSLDAAMVKTVDNFQHQKNPLVKELDKTILEVRAGKPRSEALRDLAERTMVDDIKSFASMLIQTEKFGTSLGKTLRSYSESLRMKRKQMAEESAAKTAVKMLLPLTFCVFPALLVVMLAPAFFRIYTVLLKH